MVVRLLNPDYVRWRIHFRLDCFGLLQGSALESAHPLDCASFTTLVGIAVAVRLYGESQASPGPIASVSWGGPCAVADISGRGCYTAGVVSAHLGRRLSEMAGGYYDIHGARVQINADRVQPSVCKAIDDSSPSRQAT